MEYKKLSLIAIAALALAVYVLPINEWTSQVTAEPKDNDEETSDVQDEDETTEEEDEGGDADKLKDGDPDANNGNGNDAKDDDDEDEDDDPDGNPNNREGTPGTERCLERSNGNCANSPVHDGYGDTSENDVDID